MFLNLFYYLYVKFTSLFYRFIVYLSRRNLKYSVLLNDLANHNKDVIINSSVIKPFKYEIFKHIPQTFLNVAVYTENVRTDIEFLMRLYKTIINIPEFVDLGTVKIVFICSSGDNVFTIGKSMPITANTSPNDFLIHYYTAFLKLTLKGYPISSFEVLFVKTYSDGKRPLIKPQDIKTNPQSSDERILPKPSASNSRQSSENIHSSRNYATINYFNANNIKRQYSSKSTTFKPDDIGGDPSLLADFLPDSDVNSNRKRNIKNSRRLILPLKPKIKYDNKIATFDIETFVYKDKLYPYAIGLQYSKYNKIHKQIFYYENKYNSVEKNSEAILENMIDYMVENCKNYTIFAHNLGKFDGILMMNSIYNTLGPHSLIIGKDNSIISMSFKGIKLLDSLKIFTMSLKQLGIRFGVETLKGELDFSKINKDNVCNPEIKEEVEAYLIGDISCLYECMIKASEFVFDTYRINITDVYSASSLAMKHFRTSYLNEEGIPLLPRHMVDLISEAYYGGISQVYKSYGQNLYYYDVNSLYPWAMTQDMPYEYLGISYNPKLKNFFGFGYASIYVPKNIEYKPLPIRVDGSLATPSGHILGLYFSEELKYAQSIGCTITLHRGYLFSRKKVFNDYVNDMYQVKVNAVGAERVFVKLLLNGLYGYFARDDEKYIAIFLPINEAIKQAQIYPANNIIMMDDDQTALIIRDVKPSRELCEATGQKYTDYIDQTGERTKSNRAMAAAITAYSRIRIHEFKMICGDIYYSDTDSIVTGNKLPDEYINDGLGNMKEEYNEDRISEAIFISPKLYGLRFKSGKEIVKARGVQENKLSFDDLLRIHNGEEIILTRTQLFKSLEFASIVEKDLKIRVNRSIPVGKIPKYDDKGELTHYEDMENTLMSAINNNPLKFNISNSLKKIIKFANNAIDKLKNKES